MKRFFALTISVIFAASICSAAEFRKWGVEDIEWGYGTWISAGGVTSTKVPYPYSGAGTTDNAAVIDVRAYGTITFGAGVTSGQKTANAAAIQNSINSVTGGGATILLPPGIIYVDGGVIKINKDGIHLKGQGIRATKLYWDSGIAITMSKTATETLVNTSVNDLSLQGIGTSQKTGIKIVDGSETELGNVVIYSSPDDSTSSNGSIGLQIQGRDTLTVKKATMIADKPISIEVNPNINWIGIDQTSFRDIYLITTDNTQACVTIASNVNVTNVTFDGFQAWAKGKYGLYWNDTETTSISSSISINNVRWEQASDSAGWFFYINYNSNVYHLTIRNSFGAYDGVTATVPSNGIYLRNVYNVTLDQNLIVAGSGKYSYNIDSTNRNVMISNSHSYITASTILPSELISIKGFNDGGFVFYDSYPTSVRIGTGLLIRNGGFTANTEGWQDRAGGTVCTLASVSGGKSDNCLEITRVGGSYQAPSQSVSLTVGKSYKLTAWVKSGTSGNETAYITVIGDNTSTGHSSGTVVTSGTWQQLTSIFTADDTNHYVYLVKTTATPGTMLFDSVELVESVPNIVGVPASSSAAGTAGQVSYDNTYSYWAYGDNTWRRVAYDNTW